MFDANAWPGLLDKGLIVFVIVFEEKMVFGLDLE
jgi:hypothetical protein